jgi:uncharacterized protein (UPF0261 family)
LINVPIEIFLIEGVFDKSMQKTIVVIGTMDTKGPELAYLANQVISAGCKALLMDIGTNKASQVTADIPVEEIVSAINTDIVSIRAMPRGEAVAKISEAAAIYLKNLVENNKAHGVIGLGGSGGTTACCAAMRSISYGIPKFMVSTLASGNTRWHIDISDIVMIPSLLDISGLNPMLTMVLRNAAYSIAGMVKGHDAYEPSGKKVISLTMYGTTTPGVGKSRQLVDEAGFETWVFHASGIGGRTMERLMSIGRIHAVMDMTLAEIGAHIVGGLHDAGPDRLSMASDLGLPQVIVPGAADTIVLPPIDQVPEKFGGRTLNYHNPTMTTMRTTPEENIKIADFIATKVNKSKGPVCVILPLGGVSTIDKPGRIFYDPAANDALFSTLKKQLASHIEIVEDAHHIDDPEFATIAASKMIRMINAPSGM